MQIRNLIIAGVGAIPVMALSMIPFLQFSGWQWVVLVLSLPIVIWAAAPFHQAAWRGLKHGAFTMDTLVSLGIIAATGASALALIFTPSGSKMNGHIYFEGATMITFFLLLGRFLEKRSRYRATSALRSLGELGAKEARRLVLAALETDMAGANMSQDRTTGVVTPQKLVQAPVETVPIAQVQVGDYLSVLPGDKIPVDGQIVVGQTAVDQALLTGESAPVEAGPGSQVTGATINLSGSIIMRATGVGPDTVLAQITKLVTQAQAGKAPVQRLADRISAVFVPVVLILSVLTGLAWWIWGSSVFTALTVAISVVIIACPCALGLATPTALLVGTTRAAQAGILFKGPQVIESVRQLDLMIFDKTGTLTEGKMQVQAVGGVNGESKLRPVQDSVSRQLLETAAALEVHSRHPLGEAVVKAVADTKLALTKKMRDRPGHGVYGLIDKQFVLVGKPTWLKNLGFKYSEAQESDLRKMQELGYSVLAVGEAPARRTDPEAAVCSTTGTLETNPAENSATSPNPAESQTVNNKLVELKITGMTCASCVARVEKALQKVPGVQAQVNLVTEQAQILVAAQMDAESLVEAVRRSGYQAQFLSDSQTSATSLAEALGGHRTLFSVPDPTATDQSDQEIHDLIAPHAQRQILGLVGIKDQIRVQAKTVIDQLRDSGVESCLLSGDNFPAAQGVAKNLGIRQVRANVLPADKQKFVAQQQAKGKFVAMVGDGNNDAIALVQASQKGLGIALGSGTDVAIDSADIVLMRPDLELIPSALTISRLTLRTIKQNLVWAFGYNVAAIPLAMLGMLNPMVASACMAMSSVLVVANSLLLRQRVKHILGQ